MDARGIEAEIVAVNCDEEEGLKKIGADYDAFVSMDTYGSPDTAVPLCKVGSSDFYFAVSKDRPDLLAELDAALNNIQNEDKYYDQKLHDKYLKSTETDKYLGNTERRWLAEHGAIRVGYQDNYLAFCAKDKKDGDLTGALKDYLDYASSAFMNQHIEFETIVYPTASDAIDALKKGEIDCVFPSNLTSYDAQMLDLVMSPPLMRTEMDAVVRESVQKEFVQKKSVTVAVNEGNTNYDLFLEENYPGWERTYFKDTPQALEAVAAGSADCVIISNYRYSNISKQCEKLHLATVYTGVDMDFCFAVNMGDPQLYSILSSITRVVPDSVVNTALTYYSTEDERRLAEKLVESHILGRIMMRVNGVDIASVNKRGKPGFTDPEMQRIYEEKRKNLKKRDTQKKLTKDAFIQKDAIAGASLKETNVYKNEKVNALKEEKKQLAKKALDNMLSIKGRKLAEPDSAPDEFTEEKLESDLKELEQISASDVKFSSYAEMINNFGHNMAICERAEEIHFNLVRGIARGVKIPDERMKELRAKLLFLHEVRYTMTVINKALATDENFTGKTDEEWSRSIKNSRTKNGQLKKLYLVPGDVEAMFAKCRENVNNEFEKRDDYIKAVWKMMHSTYKTETVIKNGREETEESVTAAGEIPAEELERRRAEYQSNQAASEFLNRNSELSNSMGHVRAVMEAYCKKNGLTYNEPPRLISSYLKDKSASEIIRFYKLYSGTAGDKFRCWKEIDEAVNKVPLKDFDTRDLARWTDNYYRTSAMAIVHANANDISKEMKKLIEDRKNRGWLKVPSRYRDMEEMERKYNILYGFGCSYTSGRLNALQQTDASSYRGALSIKELGSIDAANMDNILKVLMYYENQGVETEEFENIQKLINQAQFIGPEIKTRPLSEADRRAGKLMERASFDTDIEELYKEESDAYDLKHLPEVNAEINNITSSLNKTLEKYREKTGTDVWRQKYHSHGDREGRVARYMTNCMAYLKKYDEKQALELYDGLMIDTKKNVGPEEKQRRSRSFERIFEELLTFDLTKFNFEDPKEFIRPDKKDVRVFGSMVWDMHTDEFDAYEDLIDDKDAQCALTKEQLNEVRARWELFQVISRWAGQVPLSAEIPEAREFDMLDILNNKSLEEIRQIMNDNKSPGMALYISGLMYLKDTLSKGFGPKTDAAGLLKEYRKKYGINGDRHGKEALEAIRKKLAKK